MRSNGGSQAYILQNLPASKTANVNDENVKEKDTQQLNREKEMDLARKNANDEAEGFALLRGIWSPRIETTSLTETSSSIKSSFCPLRP